MRLVIPRIYPRFRSANISCTTIDCNMKVTVCLLVFLSFVAFGSALFGSLFSPRRPYCDDGLKWNKCAPCFITCEDQRKNITCNKRCYPDCTCPEGQLWDDIVQKCVNKDACFKGCPGEQVFYRRCKPCNETCDDIFDPKPCNLSCVRGCGCRPGWVWSEEKYDCVRKIACLKKCTGNQIYYPKCAPCKSTCNGPTPCPKICKPGCGCPPGWVWSDAQKCCIPVWTCPQSCPAGQVYGKCKPCIFECKELNTDKICTKDCKPGCACPPDTYWNGEKCLTEAQCQETCPNGQEYQTCKPCNTDCKDLNKTICSLICEPGCACPNGTYWNGRECVTADKCPKKCPDFQIYYRRCAPCNNTCDGPLPCPKICKPDCACPPRWVWSFWYKQCVPLQLCDKGPWDK